MSVPCHKSPLRVSIVQETTSLTTIKLEEQDGVICRVNGRSRLKDKIASDKISTGNKLTPIKGRGGQSACSRCKASCKND